MNDGFGVDISLLPDHVHHSLMDWFPFSLIAGLALGFIIGRIVSRSREKASENALAGSSSAGSDCDTTTLAPFGSPAMAARALAHEETVYWQQLLAAFAAAIEAEGYTFGTDARAKVALPHDTRALAGAAIVKARSRHLSPQQSEASLEDFLQEAARDGYAGSWADWCQRGAEAAGWYVIRREVNPPTDRGSTE